MKYFILSFIFLISCSHDSKKNNFKKEQSRESITENNQYKMSDPVATPQELKQGATLCAEQKIDQGLDFLDQLYSTHKKNPSYWSTIGDCYFYKRAGGKAVLFYNRALELDPKYAPAYNNLGLLYIYRGEDSKALLAFEKASILNPQAIVPLINRGKLYLKYNMLDSAQKTWSYLLTKIPENPSVLAGLATVSFFKADYNKAITYFSKITEDLMTEGEWAAPYAVALKLSGQVQKAKNIITKIDKKTISAEALQKAWSVVEEKK